MTSCTINNCERPLRTKDWCNSHYENWRRYGYAIPQRDWTLAQRIEAAEWIITQSGCWEWQGKRNDQNYGIFNARRLGLENQRAHRVVYEFYTGIKLGGKILLHHCDNPPCVNPEHLSPGTQADNVADMIKKGRSWVNGRTHCKNGHDILKDGSTRIVRKNDREYSMCVECNKLRQRRYEEKCKARPITWSALQD